MFSDFKQFYNDLKQHDTENRLSMKNKSTISINRNDGVEVLLHDSQFETYIEFKRDGKRFSAYRPEYHNAFDDMLGYMKGTKPLPSEEEYNKQNKLVMIFLCSGLAVLVLLNLLFDFSGYNLNERVTFSISAVLAVWAAEIIIKKLIDKKGK